eukprot:2690449-Rhodomonas_salina.4
MVRARGNVCKRASQNLLCMDLVWLVRARGNVCKPASQNLLCMDLVWLWFNSMVGWSCTGLGCRAHPKAHEWLACDCVAVLADMVTFSYPWFWVGAVLVP